MLEIKMIVNKIGGGGGSDRPPLTCHDMQVVVKTNELD
jgi:hypothetical protein